MIKFRSLSIKLEILDPIKSDLAFVFQSTMQSETSIAKFQMYIPVYFAFSKFHLRKRFVTKMDNVRFSTVLVQLVYLGFLISLFF